MIHTLVVYSKIIGVHRETVKPSRSGINALCFVATVNLNAECGCL